MKLRALLALVALMAPPATAQVSVERVTQHTIVLDWKAFDYKRPVSVWVSEKYGKTKGKPVVRDDRDGGEAVTFYKGGTRPYFYVKPKGKKGVWVAERTLPLEGGRNFRDLGGYSAKDGKRVRWGQLYRSAAMTDLTVGDYRYLGKLGIRSVCDLRSTSERAAAPNKWVEAAKISYWTRDYADASGGLRALFVDPKKLKPEPVRRAFAGFYRQMPDEFASSYREMFAQLLAGRAPLAFNCTAGKDRTGLGAALILTALGVDYDLVMQDYLLSNDARRPASEEKDPTLAALSRALPEEVLPLIAGVDRSYLNAAYDAIREKYGSVDRYLEQQLGVGKKERQALRKRYLQ